MSKLERNKVFQILSQERAYQNEKWEQPESSVPEYLHYISNYLRKAVDTLSTDECVGVCDTVLSQIRKITALGLACAEEHGVPARQGFDLVHRFVHGDIIKTEGRLFRCIASDEINAVFAPCEVQDTGGLATTYKNMITVPNTYNVNFKYERIDINDLSRSISEAT